MQLGSHFQTKAATITTGAVGRECHRPSSTPSVLLFPQTPSTYALMYIIVSIGWSDCVLKTFTLKLMRCLDLPRILSLALAIQACLAKQVSNWKESVLKLECALRTTPAFTHHCFCYRHSPSPPSLLLLLLMHGHLVFTNVCVLFDWGVHSKGHFRGWESASQYLVSVDELPPMAGTTCEIEYMQFTSLMCPLSITRFSVYPVHSIELRDSSQLKW